MSKTPTTPSTGSQALPGNLLPRGSASSATQTRQSLGQVPSQAEPGTEAPGAEPCADYADLLVDLSDGELPQPQRDQIVTHVAACAGCREELSRLDRSLAKLASGVVTTDVTQGLRAGWLSFAQRTTADPPKHVAAVAAIGLACLLAVSLAVRHFQQPPPRPAVVNAPSATPTVAAAPVMSQADALRRIALLEQQARLQTSLDLMPQAAWYDQQRADNQRLLDGFKAATGTASPSPDHVPATGETL